MPDSDSSPINFELCYAMKKKLKQLKRLNKFIRECEQEAATIRTLPYYRIFRQEAQQKADLFAVQLRLEGWLLEKEELLVSLQAY